jgi:RNase P subunit RPR2
MFSTYCPTCQTMVLLGTRRIVHFPGEGGPQAVLLRCTCGTVVNAAAEAPTQAPTHAPAPELAEAS